MAKVKDVLPFIAYEASLQIVETEREYPRRYDNIFPESTGMNRRILEECYPELLERELSEEIHGEGMKDGIYISVYKEEKKGRYEIYQMKKGDSYHKVRYMAYDMVKKELPYLCADDYDKVYEGEIESKTESEMLDELYYQFNMARPKDFTGHSLSVSDVIVLDGKAFYVDDIGFKKIDFSNKKLED